MNTGSLDSAWERLLQPPYCRLASEIEPVEIMADNRPIFRKCLAVLKQYMTKGLSPRAPLKGFLFEGPPGTGKTELARQIGREASLFIEPRKGSLYLVYLDGASIASPRWGDAEQTLLAAFSLHKSPTLGEDSRVVLLFDDIESLMLARSLDIAKEWHFSINAVLFHALDRLDSSRNFVLATMNRPDLIDEALRDRLYSIYFHPPSKEALLQVASGLLRDMGDIDQPFLDAISSRVAQRLNDMDSPTLRDVQRLVVMECIESGVWEL